MGISSQRLCGGIGVVSHRVAYHYGMRTRTIFVRLSILASLLAIALSALPATPALAGSTGPQSASYDLRASETSSAGQFRIAVGQPATFQAWVDPVGHTTVGNALTFGEVVDNIYQGDPTAEVYLELSYGWSPSCSTLGPGDPQTDDGCEHVDSPNYTSTDMKIPQDQSWTVTTPTAAPAGTETLFYDFQLYGQSSPGAIPQLLLQAAAGAVVLNPGQPTMAIDAVNRATGTPYPLNAFTVHSGTQIDVETCLTTDNCQVGWQGMGTDFLTKNEYICAMPLGNYSGINPSPSYYPGGVTQILTWPDVEYTPPPGKNWTFKFVGFISKHAKLPTGATEKAPYLCPPFSSSGQPLYATSVGTASNRQTLAMPDPVLEVTWQGPTFTPPSVGLSATLTQQAPGKSVSLYAAYQNSDGAKNLYICARSGTSWLQVAGDQSPYLAEDTLPLSGQEGSGSASSPSGTGGTAQFVAFLSDDPPGSFAHCPQSATVGTYGTQYDGDWSNIVNVTWAATPEVSLSVLYDGETWTDQSPSAKATAYETVVLQGGATDLTSLPFGEDYSLYLCSPTSPQPSSLSLSGPWPYADSGTQVYPPSGMDLGSASAQGVTAGFVAFLSTDSNYPSDTNNACPTAPTGSAGAPGDVLAVSPVLNVTWQSYVTVSGAAYPD